MRGGGFLSSPQACLAAWLVSNWRETAPCHGSVRHRPLSVVHSWEDLDLGCSLHARWAPGPLPVCQGPQGAQTQPQGRWALAFIRYSSDSIFFFEAIFSDFQREYKEYLRI